MNVFEKFVKLTIVYEDLQVRSLSRLIDEKTNMDELLHGLEMLHVLSEPKMIFYEEPFKPICKN